MTATRWGILMGIAVAFSLLFSLPATAQEKEEAEKILPSPLTTGPSLYTSVNRRDPFKDLLVGTESKERPSSQEGQQLSIDDLTLIGILRVKGKLQAIVSGPQGFPYRIKQGDRFADGYVLSIDENKVTFRKTSERGLKLYQPRDIVKELSPEEL